MGSPSLQDFPTRLDRLTPLILNVCLGSVVVLGLAALTALALRRGSAAARHQAWTAGVVGALVLPILSATLPGWHILPRLVGPQRVPLQPAAAPPPPTSLPIQSEQLSTPSSADDRTTETAALRSLGESLKSAPSQANSSARSEKSAASTTIDVSGGTPWTSWLLVCWIAGGLLVIGHVVLGHLSLWWLRRRCTVIRQGEWFDLLKQIRTEIGLRRRVELLSSRARVMPMTWGLWRARLLVPEGAAAWPAIQRRDVLLHELGHVRRWDCLTQFLSQVACAVYWFNPLAWVADRRMRVERERACDDLVLNHGSAPSAYARHLLASVASVPTFRLSGVAIAMARPSTLEERMRAILNTRLNRRGLSARGSLAMVLLLLLALTPVATLRAQQDPAQDPTADRAPVRSERAQDGGSRAQPATRPTTNPEDRTPVFTQVSIGTDAAAAEGKAAEKAVREIFRPTTTRSGKTSWSSPILDGTGGGDKDKRAFMLVNAHRGDRWPVRVDAQEAPLFHAKLVDGDAKKVELEILAGKDKRRVVLELDKPEKLRVADKEFVFGYGTTMVKGSEPRYVDHAVIMVSFVRGDSGTDGQQPPEADQHTASKDAKPLAMIVPLGKTKAAEAAKTLNDLTRGTGIDVTVDDRTNSLVFHGDPARLKETKAALENLQRAIKRLAPAGERVRVLWQEGRHDEAANLVAATDWSNDTSQAAAAISSVTEPDFAALPPAQQQSLRVDMVKNAAIVRELSNFSMHRAAERVTAGLQADAETELESLYRYGAAMSAGKDVAQIARMVGLAVQRAALEKLAALHESNHNKEKGAEVQERLRKLGDPGQPAEAEQRGAARGDDLFVIASLRDVRADKAAAKLESLTREPGLKVIVDDRSNALLLHGKKARVEEAQAVLRDLGYLAPLPQGQKTDPEPPENGVADDAKARATQTKRASDATGAVGAYLHQLTNGEYDEAYSATTNTYKQNHPQARFEKGFAQVAAMADLSQLKIDQVLVTSAGTSSAGDARAPHAAAVTTLVTSRQGDRKIALGLGLVNEGGGWLVRDIDMLPDEPARERFMSDFRKAHSDAKREQAPENTTGSAVSGEDDNAR